MFNPVKLLAQVLVVGSMLLVTVLMIQWAFTPEPRPDAEEIARSVNQKIIAQREAEKAASEAPKPGEEGQEAGQEGAEGAESEGQDPASLIASAKPAEQTTVQVLQAGGSQGDLDQATAILKQHGYDIIATSRSKRRVTKTTVYYTDAGTKPAAEALRARDPRFQLVTPNEGLKAPADIHVLVGPDF